MAGTPLAMILLGVVVWASLLVLVVVFLRIALRPDAGFGAAARGHRGRRPPPRPGGPGTFPGA